MNIQLRSSNLFVGSNSIFQNRGLKSTQEKMRRQAERDNQIAFLENQRNNLKNMKCDSLEKISRKLDLFHSYEDQIEAAKEEYNQAQMFHVMDEAKERGEQIAKAAEKYAPKTPEERKDEVLEELVEEALGTDESKGELNESMEELAELSEELSEGVSDELAEIPENLPQEEMSEHISEELTEKVTDSNMKNTISSLETESVRELNMLYKKVDIRI
ncbi:MAG: hypothetical protein ACI4ES_09560 [Roseburia sp.]